jgi:hypothetical protein
MAMDFIFWAGLLVGGASAIAEFLLRSWDNTRKKQREKLITAALNAEINEEDRKTLDELGLTDEKAFQQWLDLIAVSSPAASPNANAVTVSMEIERLKGQLQQLRQHVIENKNEIIEVQRIDPILEATLKVTVENVVKRLELLEKQCLNKWDVALVVAQILGTLGLLLGLTFGIIKYLHP